MAYVPTTDWLQGPDRLRATNKAGFWIDLYPATVREYLPIARSEVANHHLEDYNSFLLTKIAQAGGLAATGLIQTPKLLGDLGKIFDVINAEKRAAREPEEGKPLPEGTVPCDDCPAPMTLIEAQLFCKSRGMHLPTASEWELAARGVDGRLYTWGNRFDPDRANVVGLPDKGQRFDLRSVNSFPNGRSPFGVLDMVGNAGDWVDTEGAYEKTFMGGTYRFNKEDSPHIRPCPTPATRSRTFRSLVVVFRMKGPIQGDADGMPLAKRKFKEPLETSVRTGIVFRRMSLGPVPCGSGRSSNPNPGHVGPFDRS